MPRKLKTTTLATNAFRQDEKIKEIEKQLKEEKKKLDAMKHELYNRMKEEEQAQIKTATGITVRPYVLTTASIENPQRFYDFIKKHEAYDLLQRRVSMTALKERWEHNEKVPGLEINEIPKLSITKSRG